jgi:hypothetical protein
MSIVFRRGHVSDQIASLSDQSGSPTAIVLSGKDRCRKVGRSANSPNQAKSDHKTLSNQCQSRGFKRKQAPRSFRYSCRAHQLALRSRPKSLRSPSGLPAQRKDVDGVTERDACFLWFPWAQALRISFLDPIHHRLHRDWTYSFFGDYLG